MGRKPLKAGGGRKPRKNLRASSTYLTRLAAIKHFEATGDMPATVERFFPELSDEDKRSKKRVIYGWIKAKAQIEQACECVSTANTCRLRKPGVGTALSEDAEKCIVVWLRSMQQLGVPVTAAMLSAHAVQVAREIGLPDGLFVASGQWRKSFLKRHSL